MTRIFRKIFVLLIIAGLCVTGMPVYAEETLEEICGYDDIIVYEADPGSSEKIYRDEAADGEDSDREYYPEYTYDDISEEETEDYSYAGTDDNTIEADDPEKESQAEETEEPEETEEKEEPEETGAEPEQKTDDPVTDTRVGQILPENPDDPKKEDDYGTDSSDAAEKPAFDKSVAVDGVTVTVTAPEGVFPADAVLSVESVPVYTQEYVADIVDPIRRYDRGSFLYI